MWRYVVSVPSDPDRLRDVVRERYATAATRSGETRCCALDYDCCGADGVITDEQRALFGSSLYTDGERGELPGAAVRAATSTAEAVREVVAATGRPWAALGPASAAALYGCRVLRERVDDEPDNATRFVWLARAGTSPAGEGDLGGWKTSVVFAGAGDQAPGWLVRCLSEFAFRGVNLTRIESRPRRARLGHYLFHVDMEGRAADPAVADAIAALGRHCEEVRLLGSYPAA
jgi:prephenate dehydratase